MNLRQNSESEITGFNKAVVLDNKIVNTIQQKQTRGEVC